MTPVSMIASIIPAHSISIAAWSAKVAKPARSDVLAMLKCQSWRNSKKVWKMKFDEVKNNWTHLWIAISSVFHHRNDWPIWNGCACSVDRSEMRALVGIKNPDGRRGKLLYLLYHCQLTRNRRIRESVVDHRWRPAMGRRRVSFCGNRIVMEWDWIRRSRRTFRWAARIFLIPRPDSVSCDSRSATLWKSDRLQRHHHRLWEAGMEAYVVLDSNIGLLLSSLER